MSRGSREDEVDEVIVTGRSFYPNYILFAVEADGFILPDRPSRHYQITFDNTAPGTTPHGPTSQIVSAEEGP